MELKPIGKNVLVEVKIKKRTIILEEKEGAFDVEGMSIKAIGEDVTKLKVGDKIILNSYASIPTNLSGKFIDYFKITEKKEEENLGYYMLAEDDIVAVIN